MAWWIVAAAWAACSIFVLSSLPEGLSAHVQAHNSRRRGAPTIPCSAWPNRDSSCFNHLGRRQTKQVVFAGSGKQKGARQMTEGWGGMTEQGPEMQRLTDRLFNGERKVSNIRFDWGPEAHKMTAEERAAMLNAAFDEIEHPLTGIAGRLEGEAMLLEDSAHPRRDYANGFPGEEIPLTAEQKRDGRLAELLREAGRLLRECAAQGTEAQRAETVEQGSVHDGPVGKADAPKDPSISSQGS